MVEMAKIEAPISQGGVAVHLECWCVCLCYLHFASVSWYHFGTSQPGLPRQSPESCNGCVCVCGCAV